MGSDLPRARYASRNDRGSRLAPALRFRQQLRHAAEGGDEGNLDRPLPEDSRTAEGFSAVTPAGAILGVLTGTELIKVEVAIGVYGQKPDERIAQINAECGL